MKVADLYATLGLRPNVGSFKKGNDLLAGVGKALIAFVGYKVVSGVGEMVSSVVELGSSLNDTATKTGLSVEALQEYGYIAKLNGSNTEELTGAVAKLARGLDEAATTAKGPAHDALQRLGLRMGDLKKLTLDQKITKISEALANVKDPSTRSALAMSLFGRGAAGLIPTFVDVAEHGAALRQEFRDLGGEITTGDASKLDNLGDDLDRLKTVWQGIKNQVVVALVPVLQQMATGFLTWVRANRELLASKVQAFVSGLATVLRATGRAVAFVVEHWESFAAILGGVAFVGGILRIIKLIQWLQLASTMAAAKMLIAWAVAALPFVAIAALVALVVLALTKYRKQTEQVVNLIKQKFKNLAATIASPFIAAFNAIKNTGAAIIDWISRKIDWVLAKIESVKKAAGRFVNGSDEGRQRVLDTFGISREQADSLGPGVAPSINLDAVTPRAQSNQTSMTFGDINVQSSATDPVAVGLEVRNVVREEWGKQMLHTFAGTGAE